MKGEHKTKEQLINELVELRQRVAELETSETERKQAEELAGAQRDLALALGAALGLDEALRLCLETAIRISGMDCGGIYLVDDASGALDLVLHKRLPPDFVSSASHYEADSPSAQLVMVGQPVYSEHLRLGVSLDEVRRREALRAIAILPVHHEDRVIACLNVASHTLDEVPAFSRTALEAIAARIGSAIARVQAEESLRERTAQLEALREVGLKLTAQLDLDSLLHSIVSQAIELVGGASGGLYLCRSDRDVLEWSMAVGPHLSPIGTVLHRGEGLSGKVWETGKALIVDDYQAWEKRAAVYEGYPFKAVVAAPVCWGEEFLGVLNVLADHPQTFSPADAELLSLFATQAAIAIQNARLYEETHSRAERLAVVNRIARAVGATLNLDELMETVYQEIASIFQADAFFIALYDEETNELDFRIQVDEGVREPPQRQSLGVGLTSLVVTEKKSLLIRSLEQKQDRLPTPELWGTMKLPASWLGAPMLIGERLIGVICIQAYRPHAYGEEEQQLLSTIADQVAVAVESSRLFQAEREQRELAEALEEEAAAVVSSTLDPDQVLDRILEQVSRVVPNDAANIMLIAGDEARVARWRSYERFGAEEFVSTVVFRIPEVPNLQQMMESGEPLVIPDTATYPGWVRVPVQEWLRSYAAAPIVVRGEVIGFLNVDSATPGFFTQAHAEALRVFADHAAATIENARLFEAERERSTQLGAVARVAERIASILNPDELLRETVELITQTFGYYYAAIMLLDAEANELVFNVGAGGYAGRTPAGFRQEVKEGMIGWAAHLGKTVWANDVSQEPRYIPAYLSETRSELDVPLKYHDRVIGVLDLQSRELNAFTPHDVMAMETLAGHVAAAIENARLYEETRQRALEQETLREAALALTTALDRNEVIDRILAQLQWVVPYDSASVQLLQEDRLVIIGGHGFPNLPDLLGVSFPVDGDNPNSEVIRTQAPVIVRDAPTVYEAFRKGPHRQAAIRSWLGAPMLIGEQLVGMIALDKREPGFYTQQHARLAEAFAAQAAIAIENARLYEQVTRHVKALSTLHEISQELTSTLEPDQVLHAIAEDTIKLTGAASSIFLLVDPEAQQMVLATGHGYSREHLEGFTFEEFEAGISGWVRRERKPALAVDAQTDARQTGIALQHAKQHGSRSLVTAPLWIKEEVVGTLTAVGTADTPVFTDETLELVVMLANQAAIAIENARLFEEIEERRLYLEGVLGAAPDAVVTLDDGFRVVEWNTGAERLFGYSPEEVVGQNLDDLITNPDVFEEATGFTQEALGGKALPPTETVRYRKDGSPVDVIVAGSPILVGDEVVGAVAVYTDITARVRMEETLRALALLDELTDLYNRRGFLTLGQQQLKTANRAKRSMVLLFADLDGMKRINDAFGHPEGDRALIETASVFRETFRESDIIARIGGDEFVVLAVETNGSPAEVLIHRLQENLETRNAREGRRYELSLSVGLARYDPESPCSIDELVAQADRAMYEKKRCEQKSGSLGVCRAGSANV